jgi:hypothetical protein
LGERRLCKADVRGSNPLISTWLRMSKQYKREDHLVVDLLEN